MPRNPQNLPNRAAQNAESGSSTPKPRFSATAARLMAAIFETGSIKAGAKQIGLSERQANRICSTKIFSAVWREQQRDLTILASEIIKSEMCKSIITLRELRDNPKTPATARLSAASKLLDLGVAQVAKEEERERDHRMLDELQAKLDGAAHVDEITVD